MGPSMACKRLVVQGANQQERGGTVVPRNHHAHHRPSPEGRVTRVSKPKGGEGVPAEAACLTFNTDH